MVSIRTSSIDVFRYMRAPHCACVKSTFPHAQEKISDAICGGDWIFLSDSSIKHVPRHVNMLLLLNQNLGVVYLLVCMCMLSTCLSCTDASLLLSIGIEKSIVLTVLKVKYSVSYWTEKNLVSPTPNPLVRYPVVDTHHTTTITLASNAWSHPKIFLTEQKSHQHSQQMLACCTRFYTDLLPASLVGFVQPHNRDIHSYESTQVLGA